MKILISYISSEEPVASTLKKWIESTFLGTCNVVLTEDFRLRHDFENKKDLKWREELEKELDSSKLLIIVGSPKSLRSLWINYCIGCGSSKGIPIIVVCHSGQTKEKLLHPISELKTLEMPESSFAKDFLEEIAEYLQIRKLPNIAYKEMIAELLKAQASTAEKTNTLSLWNSLNYMRLLWWVWVKPSKFEYYKRELDGEEKAQLLRIGVWLTSTLVWFPLLAFVIYSWLSEQSKFSPEVAIGLITGISLAWLFTGHLGHIQSDIGNFITTIFSLLIVFVTPTVTLFDYSLSARLVLGNTTSILVILLASFSIGAVFAIFAALLGTPVVRVSAFLLRESRLIPVSIVGWAFIVGIPSSLSIITCGGGAIETGVTACFCLLLIVMLDRVDEHNHLKQKWVWIILCAIIVGLLVVGLIYFIIRNSNGIELLFKNSTTLNLLSVLAGICAAFIASMFFREGHVAI